MTVTALARTLDQELVALARGASLACPVCSEFVLHVRGAHGLAIACPECRSILAEGHEVPELALPSVAQTRVAPTVTGFSRSPGLRPRLPAHWRRTARAALPSLTQAG